MKSYPRKNERFLKATLLIFATCWPLIGASEVVFEARFDGTDAHEWNTGQAHNFFIEPEEGIFSAQMENRVPESPPARYAVVEVDLDPTESFRLTWNELVEFEGFGRANFGLFSSDLIAENRTRINLPQLLSASTVNLGLSGSNREGFGSYDMTVVDRNRMNKGQGGSGAGRDFSGQWLQCEIVYEREQGDVRFIVSSIAEEDETNVLLDFDTTVAGFSTDMVHLGFSNYPIGLTPNQIWTTHPDSVARVEVKNIVLEGSRLSNAQQKPGLEVSSVVSGKESVLVEESFEIGATVKNRGSIDIHADRALIFLSEDRHQDEDDYQLQQTGDSSFEVFADPFMAGDERTFSGVVMATDSTPSGRYFVIVEFLTRAEDALVFDTRNLVNVSDKQITVNNPDDKPVIETGTTAEIKTEQDGSRSFLFPFWAEEGMSHTVLSFGDITSRVGTTVSNILGNGEFLEARFPIDLTREFEFFRVGVEKPQEPTEPVIQPLPLEIAFQIYPRDQHGQIGGVRSPNWKPHRQNIVTRQDEAGHYEPYRKCVAHVWDGSPINLAKYLEGYSENQQLFEDDAFLSWRVNGVSTGFRVGLQSALSEVETFERLNVEVAIASDALVLDHLIITIIPPETVTEFEDWHRENSDLAWLDELPIPYGWVILEGGGVFGPLIEPKDPEPEDCETQRWQKPKHQDDFYHPAGIYKMRSEVAANGAGHQAIFNASGILITSGISAGSADRSAPLSLSNRTSDHEDTDVRPFIWALQIDGNPVGRSPFVSYLNLSAPALFEGHTLSRYFERRPPLLPNTNPLNPGTCQPTPE